MSSKGDKDTSEMSASSTNAMEGSELENLVASLRLEIENLKGQNAASKQQTKNTLSTSGNANVASSNMESSVFYVARDKKIKPYIGTKDERELENFIEEVESAINVRKIPASGQTAFIVSLLEGTAREEIRLRRADREDAQTLLALLRDAFGEKRSTTQLLRDFYNPLVGGGACCK